MSAELVKPARRTFAEKDSVFPGTHTDWQRANNAYYEDAWQRQRAAPGDTCDSASPEWFERHWQISNRYWGEFLTRHANGRRMLECGAATGRLPLQLTKEGWHCTLVDITAQGPLLARKRFERERLSAWLVRGDVFHLPFADESFDVAFSSGLLDLLPDINTAILEMTRVLRPGGLFVASVDPRRGPVQTGAERLLSAARWARRVILRGGAGESHRPTTAKLSLCRNNLSLDAYMTACRSSGLHDVHGGLEVLPVVPFGESVMRYYVRLTRPRTPWMAKWAVMQAVHGFK